MGASSASLHEDPDVLGKKTIDQHRAIVSLMEEFEAADWYDQRVQAATDDGLREILAHNRDEEKEHAAMVLEWLRRNDPALDEHLRTYLFTEGSIIGVEKAGKAGESGAGDGSLGIGSLRDTGAAS